MLYTPKGFKPSVDCSLDKAMAPQDAVSRKKNAKFSHISIQILTLHVVAITVPCSSLIHYCNYWYVIVPFGQRLFNVFVIILLTFFL